MTAPGERATGQTGQNGTAVLLFVLMLFCFAFPFRGVLYDNVLSRLDLTYALVLHRTTRIDAYHSNTLDKALVKGHYYCDKAPGLSLAGVPVLVAITPFVPTEALRPENKVVHYILVMLLIAVPSAAAAVLLFRLMSSLTQSRPAALMLAVAYGAGTAALHYSTLFIAHQFAANLVIFALCLLYPAFKGKEAPAGSLLLAGLLLGWAVISEYPSAVSAAVVVGCFFVASRQRWKVIWLFPGLLLSAGVLALYNHVSFGGPFSIGYHHEVLGYYREEMGAGLFGVTVPKPLSFLAILFMPTRGLFWMSPFLLFSVFGFAAMLKGGANRTVGVLCLTIALLRILVVSGYYEPWGGFSSGSRFLTGALPFLALPVAAGWTRIGTFWKRLLAALCLFSVAQALFLNAVEPRVPFMIKHPLVEYALVLFHEGFEPASILRNFSIGFSAEWIIVIITLAVFFIFFIRSAGGNAAKYTVRCFAAAAVFFAIYYAIASALPSSRQDYVFYYTGVSLRQNGIYGSAAWRLLKAVKIAKEPFPAARFALGITHVRLEEFDEAEENFRLAIEEGFSGPRAHVSLGALYLMQGKLDEAEKVLTNGLAKHPSSPELNDLMGKLQTFKGN